LLIFDPSTSKDQIDEFMRNPSSKAYLFRRNLHSFQKSVYQILVVRGLLDPNEREVEFLDYLFVIDLISILFQTAKQLRSTRVPLP